MKGNPLLLFVNDWMIRMVLDTYEIDEETARRDTIAFVGALVENGFIECTREDGTW